MEWYLAAMWGGIGGVLRALLGIRKALAKEGLSINWPLALTSILMGTVTGLIANLKPSINTLEVVSIGFATDDIIEGFFPRKR